MGARRSSSAGDRQPALAPGMAEKRRIVPAAGDRLAAGAAGKRGELVFAGRNRRRYRLSAAHIHSEATMKHKGRGVIRIGDKTDHGGTVLSTSSGTVVMGKPAA